ncbi:OmpA family protein [Ferrimonas futtsuensis]|uniref:OmpA family protein n=1 Tax=Ferrimonas futtsuensis TaxID=364764 RepID=UPI0003FBA641|nr:OmpA family protein [Ferrimonas futtsuensis]
MRGLLVVVLLSGCAQWPEQGQGGMADEKTPWESYLNSPAFQQEQQQLRQRTVEAQMGLDLLRLRGSMACLPARQMQAELLLARVRGELADGLLADAAETMLVVEDQVHRLGVRLNYVTAKLGCQAHRPSPVAASSLSQLGNSQVSRLLFSEQFADDQAELLPEFQQRLAYLATELMAHPHWHLTITGHADHRGSEEYNHTLAAHRAQSVSEFLLKQGVRQHQLTLETRGESQPVGDNTTPTGRLANRRVTLVLSTNEDDSEQVALRHWDDASRRE